mgnify:CR=1 FL=1
MIRLTGIVKRYGEHKVLNQLDLQIQDGEIFGIIGRKGSGKSTLLSILATIVYPDEGEIVVNGFHYLKHRKKVKDIIGYVPQKLNLWENLTVWENLQFWNKFSGRNQDKKRLLHTLKAVGLEKHLTTRVNQMSKGMQRKLHIAVSLIHDPEILLLDEPVAGIDQQTKFEIYQLLKTLAGQNKTIVYVTSDLNELWYVCDRIGILKNGKIAYTGTIRETINEIDYNYDLQDDEDVMDLLTKEK